MEWLKISLSSILLTLYCNICLTKVIDTMKNILVIADPVDKDQLAFTKAVSLAKFTVAKIHVVLFCYESLYIIEEEEERAKVKEMILDRTRQSWENYLKNQQLNIVVTYELAWEKYIDHWTAKQCQAVHYDLVVKSGNRSETSLHTPTDWQLFRKLKVPVYSVSTSNKNSEKAVLVALDFSSKKKSKNKLNKKLLETAFQLSVQKNSNLYVCSCIKIPELLKELSLVYLPSKTKLIQKRIEKNTEMLFEQYDIHPDNFFVKEGEPWKVITDYAKKIKADCIVIGSIGRRGIAGKLIGNTAEKVIHWTKSDLLVVPKD
jgi:universal stress protein E